VAGAETKELPFDLCSTDVQPIYRGFSGWEKPVSECKTYEELPEVFKEYCSFIEKYLDTKIAFISNGTGREQIIAVK
jgi:adenylosuccinate synthase